MKPARLALLFLLMTSPAFADGVCGASGACDTMSSNVEYKDCLAKLAQRQDDELNDLYGQVKTLLQSYDQLGSETAPLVPALKTAQKSWLAFRDAQCTMEYGMAQGGTAGGGYNSDCLCNLSYNRNIDLKRMLLSYGEQ